MEVANFRKETEWIDAAIGELRAACDDARSGSRASLAICLAGGLTPEPVYRAMSGLSLGGLSIEVWLGDERVVPAGDPARNGFMVARSFAGCAWDPSPRLRLWPEAETEEAAVSASARYEAELRASLGVRPSFDLAFLGLGADGHTASVFPLSPLLEASPDRPGPPRLAAVARAPVAPFGRMTLTPVALRSARRRIFLVKGADKLPALRRLEAEDPSIPATLLAGAGARVLYLGPLG
jgi:6-phosphogluconolactonase